MRHVGPRAEADLERREDGRLARAVLPVDEVHVGAERHRQLAVAHEVLAVDLGDHARLRGLPWHVDGRPRAQPRPIRVLPEQRLVLLVVLVILLPRAPAALRPPAVLAAGRRRGGGVAVPLLGRPLALLLPHAWRLAPLPAPALLLLLLLRRRRRHFHPLLGAGHIHPLLALRRGRHGGCCLACCVGGLGVGWIDRPKGETQPGRECTERARGGTAAAHMMLDDGHPHSARSAACRLFVSMCSGNRRAAVAPASRTRITR